MLVENLGEEDLSAATQDYEAGGTTAGEGESVRVSRGTGRYSAFQSTWPWPTVALQGHKEKPGCYSGRQDKL